MKILVVGLGKYPHHEDAWVNELLNQGHSVDKFYYFERLNESLGYLQQRTLLFTRTINKDLIQLANDILPDIILLYGAKLISPKSVLELRQIGKVVYFNPDNCFSPHVKKMFWQYHIQSIPLYDHIFAFRKSCQDNYIKLKATSCTVLHPYFVPSLHLKANQKTFEQRNIDITFIGHCENDNRVDCINEILSQKKYNVVVSGVNWHKFFKKKHNTNYKFGPPVYGDKYIDTISDSKITLSFFSKWNLDVYTSRLWEIPAIGSLAACPFTHHITKIFDSYNPIYFSSELDILASLQPYLDDPCLWSEKFQANRLLINDEKYSISGRVKEFLEQVL